MIFRRERLHLAVGALLSFGLTSCEEPAAPPEPELVEQEVPQFLVRGRWDDASALTWAIDVSGAPVDTALLRSTLERACTTWAETGCVGFRPAELDAEADFEISFQSRSHGECTPFGHDSTVAHTGPVEHGTFVHLDADRVWSEDGDAGVSLYQTLLHELGHVLGLDHTPDPAALMHQDADSRRSRLRTSDLAGIHSLYGGGEDHASDVLLLPRTTFDADPSGLTFEGAHVLRRVAPPGITALHAFDADGDGGAELIVRRTDREGQGQVMIYHFDSGPKLAKTVGPLYGLSPHDPAGFRLGVDAEGRRFAARFFENDHVSVIEWDDHGLPHVWKHGRFEGAGLLDEDGDGVLDHIEELPLEEPLRGDLDGDGTLEVVLRGPEREKP